MSRTDRRADRELLVRLVDALSVSQGRLRRDPCGDWIISGIRGHILTGGVHAYAYVPAGTARRWTKAKRDLQFMQVTQNGDTEGILKLLAMPTGSQAARLRKVIGLRRVSPLTDEQREVLARRFSSPSKTAVQTPIIGLSAVAATDLSTAPYSTQKRGAGRT